MSRSSTTSTLYSPPALETLNRPFEMNDAPTSGKTVTAQKQSTDDKLNEKGDTDPIFVDWDGPE